MESLAASISATFDSPTVPSSSRSTSTKKIPSELELAVDDDDEEDVANKPPFKMTRSTFFNITSLLR